jgi:hypothetical protein
MPAMPPDKNRLVPLISLVSVTSSIYVANTCFCKLLNKTFAIRKASRSP